MIRAVAAATEQHPLAAMRTDLANVRRDTMSFAEIGNRTYVPRDPVRLTSMRWSKSRSAFVVALGVGVGFMAVCSITATPHAQTTLPGLVVTQPPPPPASPPAQRASPPAPGAAKAPQRERKQSSRPASSAGRQAKSSAPEDGVPAGSEGPGRGGQSIVLLINDEPVTHYEVQQRARLLSLNVVGKQAEANFKRMAQSEDTNNRFRAIIDEIVRANQGKSRDQIMALIETRRQAFAQQLQQQALNSARAAAVASVTKQAQEEVIEEKLKLQEARRLGALVSDKEVERIIEGIAKQNNVTPQQFARNLANMGIDISTMKARFKANLSWRDAIRRRFSAQVAVNQRDIDRLLARGGSTSDASEELRIQRITLPLPARVDQLTMTRTLADADGVRQRFTGCAGMATLAQTVQGARFEDMKFIKATTLSEPARSLALGAKDNEMLPPQTGNRGVELYAVCERRSTASNEDRRQEAAEELQSRQFEQLASRHLRNLRQDAHVEMR